MMMIQTDPDKRYIFFSFFLSHQKVKEGEKVDYYFYLIDAKKRKNEQTVYILWYIYVNDFKWSAVCIFAIERMNEWMMEDNKMKSGYSNRNKKNHTFLIQNHFLEISRNMFNSPSIRTRSNVILSAPINSLQQQILCLSAMGKGRKWMLISFSLFAIDFRAKAMYIFMPTQTN